MNIKELGMNINLKRYIDNAIKREVKRAMLRANGRKNDDLPVSPEAIESALKYAKYLLERSYDFYDSYVANVDEGPERDQVEIALINAEKNIKEFINLIPKIRSIGLDAGRKYIEKMKERFKENLRYLNFVRVKVSNRYQAELRGLMNLTEKIFVRLS